MKDFTADRKPDLEFKINDDVFYALGDAPGGVILDLADMSDDEKANRNSAIMEFLDTALLPESAELFAERMRDPENPITFAQLLSIFEWLIDEYAGGEEADRPTKGPSSSSTGVRRTGRSSTGTARSRTSTQEPAHSDEP